MRHKYVQLDGLRGLAAVAVVLYHSSAWAVLPGGRPLVPHGYLAVDFFFLLSGFVIAHAYEERLRAPGSFLPFLRDRVIRLHPLLVLAAAIGALTMPLAPLLVPRSGAQWLASFAAATIPLPVPWAYHAFPVNGATWSLLWELIANLLFALVAAWLTTRRLVLLLVPLAAALLPMIWRFRGIDVGIEWGHQPWVFPRVAVSFLLGVLLLRVHRRGVLVGARPRPWVGLLLVLSFVALSKYSRLTPLFDAFAVLIAFPVLLLLAAGSPSGLPRLAALSGAISYPLYVLHVPLLHGIEHGLKRSGVPLNWPVGLCVLALLLLASYAAQRFYDEPVRARLRARYGGRGHRDRPVGVAAA